MDQAKRLKELEKEHGKSKWFGAGVVGQEDPEGYCRGNSKPERRPCDVEYTREEYEVSERRGTRVPRCELV